MGAPPSEVTDPLHVVKVWVVLLTGSDITSGGTFISFLQLEKCINTNKVKKLN